MEKLVECFYNQKVFATVLQYGYNFNQQMAVHSRREGNMAVTRRSCLLRDGWSLLTKELPNMSLKLLTLLALVMCYTCHSIMIQTTITPLPVLGKGKVFYQTSCAARLLGVIYQNLEIVTVTPKSVVWLHISLMGSQHCLYLCVVYWLCSCIAVLFSRTAQILYHNTVRYIIKYSSFFSWF